ncbi:MAG TPA: IclR family transcriptional regulator, partial [Microbacterium sp.]|nr:IclR family transcriptional regulator [Microbacterium sp.]
RFAALSVMADLRSATGESVHLAIRDGGEVVFISVMRGRGSAAPGSRIGGRAPVHATALGKALLAHAPANEIDAVLAEELAAFTPRTVTDSERLRRELAEVRRVGVAVEVDEHVPEVAGAASPVFSASGRVLAAISVCGTSADFDPERWAPQVRDAARRVEARLSANRPR